MFRLHLTIMFNVMGRPVTYAPPEDQGQTRTVQAIRQGGAVEIPLGRAAAMDDRLCFHVLRSAIPLPQVGAALVELDHGDIWVVQAVQPVADDPHDLKWSLMVGGGLRAVWRVYTGQDNQVWPPVHSADLRANGLAGDLSIQVRAGILRGVMRAGDVLLLDGMALVVASEAMASNNLLSLTLAHPLPQDVPVDCPANIATTEDVGLFATILTSRWADQRGGGVINDLRLLLCNVPQDRPMQAGDTLFLDGRGWLRISDVELVTRGALGATYKIGVSP